MSNEPLFVIEATDHLPENMPAGYKPTGVGIGLYWMKLDRWTSRLSEALRLPLGDDTGLERELWPCGKLVLLEEANAAWHRAWQIRPGTMMLEQVTARDRDMQAFQRHYARCVAQAEALREGRTLDDAD